MSKIFTIFLIFALLTFTPSPVCNRALSFYYSLRIGKMVESFRRVYLNAPIKIQAKYKVVMLCGIIPLYRIIPLCLIKEDCGEVNVDL